VGPFIGAGWVHTSSAVTARDKDSSASNKRNAELKSFFFRTAAIVEIKKRRLRRAEHAINITSMFGIIHLPWCIVSEKHEFSPTKAK